MQHKLRLNSNNIIEFITSGPLSLEDAVEAGKLSLEIATRLQDKQLPVLVLIDSANSPEKMDENAFKAAAMVFRDVPLSKVASFGDHEYRKLREEELARQAGKTNIYRFFKTKEEAIAWLLDN